MEGTPSWRLGWRRSVARFCTTRNEAPSISVGSDSAGEGRRTEVGVAVVRDGEVRVAEVRPDRGHPNQLRAGKVCIGEVRAAGTDPGEVRVGVIGALTVGSTRRRAAAAHRRRLREGQRTEPRTLAVGAAALIIATSATPFLPAGIPVLLAGGC